MGTLVLNQPSPKGASFSKKFSNAVGAGLEQGGRMMEAHQQKQQMAQSDDAIAQKFGIDVRGLEPEAKKLIMQAHLQGANQQQLEGIKQQFKSQQNQQKQDFLSQLFGGNQPQGQQGGMGQQLASDGQESGMQGQRGQQGQQGQKFDASKITDEDIARASVIDPNLARSLGHAKDVALREKSEEKKLKFEHAKPGNKRAEKIIEKVDALGQELPLLESSIHAMEDAVVNGDQSFWSLDNLAEATGLELFRTAKGGQFKSAAKTYFINDVKSMGARPNQFLEKMLADALTKVGRSQEANQTVIESFKFSNDLKKKYHDTARDLEKFYEETNDGYLPGSYARKIEEQMKPYVEMRQKAYEKKLKDLHIQEMKGSKKGNGKERLSGKMLDVMGPDGKLYEIDQSEVGSLPEGYILK